MNKDFIGSEIALFGFAISLLDVQSVLQIAVLIVGLVAGIIGLFNNVNKMRKK